MKYSFEFISGNSFCEYIPDNSDKIFEKISEDLKEFKILSQMDCGDIRLLAYEMISDRFNFLPENTKARIKIYD